MHPLRHSGGVTTMRSASASKLAAFAALIVLLPMLACGVKAQQNSGGEEKLQVAPMAPNSNEVPRDAASNPTGGGPANICTELQAYLSKPKEEKQEDGARRAQQSGKSNDPAKSETQSSAGLTSPVPNEESSQGNSTQAVAASDPLACREQVQKMRRAGEKLPPALLALGAMKKELLRR
jgi:hypothetical protein